MFTTSVFIHTRNDLSPSDLWVQVGDFDSPNHAFHHTRQPFKAKLPGMPERATGLGPGVVPEVDRVLMSLVSEKCSPGDTCVILAHCPGREYLDTDRLLVSNLSNDLHFNLSETTIYPISDGRVQAGKLFSSYFFV